jgi:nucleotide-binding universal stress UspA family protein
MRKFAPKQILCAVDLSPASRAVLSWARLIAEGFASRVEMVYANWSDPPRYFTEGQLSAISSEMKDQLQTMERDLQKLGEMVLGPDVSFKVSVIEGRAIDVILVKLRESPPDLIVMGSHGRSGLARLLLGSVAENVIREARCTTLIVRGPEIPHGERHLKRVLCPVNSTEMAQQSAEIASAVAARVGAELSLLRAIEDEAADEAARQKLCQWVPQDIRSHCQISEVVVRGDAAEQIILFARRENVDLIVLGAERRPFLEFSTLGRTTERVLRHGPSSVLLVPSEPTEK